MPVVLVIASAVFNVMLLSYLKQPTKSSGLTATIFNLVTKASAESGTGAYDDSATVESYALSETKDSTRFVIVDSAALLSVNNPLSSSLPARDGLMVYKVKSGDTLPKIAANFGISLNTIFAANPKLSPNQLKPGQEIVILPVNGILHQIQSGDTIDLIATEYGADPKEILTFNQGIASSFAIGSTIVVPGGKPQTSVKLLSADNLPSLSGYFAIPTTGWNWGQLHNYNGVDIANACGTPIYAAAEGLVSEVVSDGWNGGYGKYVVIEHPNGTKTKYAHNDRNLASIGDYVLKGDQIATIGNTGNTHGPTGCHLHFEVSGAKNPFAK